MARCARTFIEGGRLLTQRTDCLGSIGQPDKFAFGAQRLVSGREPRNRDSPGFWERNGWQMNRDPFRKQRFRGD